jgi:hypothetical protein
VQLEPPFLLERIMMHIIRAKRRVQITTRVQIPTTDPVMMYMKQLVQLLLLLVSLRVLSLVVSACLKEIWLCKTIKLSRIDKGRALSMRDAISCE